MPAGSFDINPEKVRKMLDEQFPQYAHLELERIGSDYSELHRKYQIEP